MELGLQKLSSLKYYNVVHKYIRTMILLQFGSPAVLPRYVTQPSLESAIAITSRVSLTNTVLS